MYTTLAKILSLLAQGRMGLSELKQAYLPKDKRLRPLISKMLEIVTKKDSPALEKAGINMLGLVAVANQKNGQREFTSVDVANALVTGGRDSELPLWLRLDCEDAGVTLIKTLESLTDSAPALYQFKHLSFQEGLFARDLLSQVDKKQWKGWQSDETAAEFLNNAYMNNVCRIAAGELGKRLAKARTSWAFSTHRLSWIGKAALWNLTKGNEYLVSIDLTGNDVGPAGSTTTSSGTSVSAPEADVDSNGLAFLFSSCPALQAVSLGFNKLGAFSPKQLNHWVKALAGNSTITELDLQSNDLGAEVPGHSPPGPQPIGTRGGGS